MKIRVGFNAGLQVSCLALIFISHAVLSSSIDVQKCIDIDDSSKRLNWFDSLFQTANENDTPNIALNIDKVEKIEEVTNSNDYGLNKPKEQSSITSEIISVKKRGSFKIYIVLENGQTWRSVKDIYDRNPVKQGEAITISEGFLSGHILRVEGNKVSLRVRRVQ